MKNCFTFGVCNANVCEVGTNADGNNGIEISALSSDKRKSLFSFIKSAFCV